MKLQTTAYSSYINNVPADGQIILAQQTEKSIVVYQAYNHAIANYAIRNRHFGGDAFSYNRMSWIKPNFLWMMYRCGWASKQNQERVLAITISKRNFDVILNEAVYSNFNADVYTNHEIWKKELAEKDVRLQWDPDHDIYGNKENRRAIQLGMKGQILEQFGREMIEEIEDVTEFVKLQKQLIDLNNIDELEVAAETIYIPESKALNIKLGILNEADD